MTEPAVCHLRRQTAHWRSALERLSRWDTLASAQAWQGLEQYLGVALRRALTDAVDRLRLELAGIEGARGGPTYALEQKMRQFRANYARVENVADFYVDALNTRGTPYMSAMLATCDRIAEHSMRSVLLPMGHARPPVLVYVDKGLGASILKAGMRLWDGRTENPAAAVKVTFHNLLRPTALIHETGHQVAHILDWNRQLAALLSERLPARWAPAWAEWASEIAADVYAFVHAGYASIAAMHDVLDGGEEIVFRHTPGDPHPISFLRVLLGVSQCRAVYGRGPWDDLADSWRARYPLAGAPERVRPLLEGSLPHLDTIGRLTLETRLPAFAGRAVTDWVDPGRVSPGALWDLEREAGPALFVSPFWAEREPVRIVALSGFRIATATGGADALLARQEQWMLRAGSKVLN